jgi:hypothetical protein
VTTEDAGDGGVRQNRAYRVETAPPTGV